MPPHPLLPNVPFALDKLWLFGHEFVLASGNLPYQLQNKQELRLLVVKDPSYAFFRILIIAQSFDLQLPESLSKLIFHCLEKPPSLRPRLHTAPVSFDDGVPSRMDALVLAVFLRHGPEWRPACLGHSFDKALFPAWVLISCHGEFLEI